MVKLELSFKSVEEAAEFLQGKSLKTAKSAEVKAFAPEKVETVAAPSKAAALMADSGPTPAQKAAATRKANKLKKEEEAKAAAAIAATIPTVAPAAAAPVMAASVMAAPAVDSKAMLDRGTALVAEMQALGVADDQLLPKLTEAYATVGLGFTKMSDLPVEQLPAVLAAIENMVAGIRGVAAPSYV